MYYLESPVSTSGLVDTGIWAVISAVIALMGGLVIYFCFLTKENDEKLTGVAKWFYDFLSFRKLFAEILLKIAYIVTAIFITLTAIGMIGHSFVGFFILLTFGNVLVRVLYEFALAMLLICKNTSEINAKMKTKEVKKVENTEEKEDK